MSGRTAAFVVPGAFLLIFGVLLTEPEAVPVVVWALIGLCLVMSGAFALTALDEHERHKR